MTDIIEQFKNLGQEAEHVLNQKYSVSKIEYILLQMLNITKVNTDVHDKLIDCFMEIIDTGYAPLEVVQFCMRELKWPKIKEQVIKRLEESDDPRVHKAMNDVLAVYEEEWEDEEFYKYYR